MVNEQLTLRFGWGDSFSFANFHLAQKPDASNVALLSCLQQSLAGDGDQFVFFWGMAGSGKSHLLQAACESAAKQGQSVAYLPLAELRELGSEIFDGLEQMSLVCIDRLECIVGQAEWETALFHLFNRVRDSGHLMFVSANAAPAGLGIDLPDLRSRLGWGPVFRLNELDDADKIAALRNRARARGFDLPTEVAEYLMRRKARDTASLFAMLDKLDTASLAQHRKLTIPFVRSLV